MTCRLRVDPGSLRRGPREISGDDHHYLFRVRRLGVGDSLQLFDGAGVEAAATVEQVTARTAVVMVGEPEARPVPQGPRLTIAQALLKGDRMDFCVQKLVELGASAIIPLRTSRTVVDVQGERGDRRRRRFESIARGAARQSGRTVVPTIENITTLDVFWSQVHRFDLLLMPWEGESVRSLRSVLPAEGPGSICVVVGPEGGFDASEVTRAREVGFTTIHLGPYILRAETAALAIASVIAFYYGDPR